VNDASPAAAWSSWANVAAISVSAGASGLVRLPLPMQISPDGDGRYADVRVVDERGVETPFAIDPERATPAREAAPVVSDFVAGRGSQELLDLGRRPVDFDCVLLSVDSEQHPTYFERVAIDAGNDRRHLRTVRSGAFIYRVADDDGKGDQRVSFPAVRARFVRIRVLDPRAPFELGGASVALTGTTRNPLEPLPLLPETAAGANEHRQVWTFSAPHPFRPSGVSFAGTSGTFVRPVRIEANADGRGWAFAGDGAIARYSDGTLETSFAFPEDTAAAWRVVVENGDDAPLQDAHPVLLAIPHELVFDVAPGRRYRLLSGNAAAPPPSYDLGVRLAHARWSASTASLGPSEPNAAYRDPRGWWKRTAWLLAVVIAIALAAGAVSAVIGRRGTASPSA
jgi:hypothetical protein